MQYDMIRGHLGNWSRESQKLTVIKRFGEASLLLFPHLTQCSQVPKEGGLILATGGKCTLPSLPT